MWPDLFRRKQKGIPRDIPPAGQEETVGQKETPDKLLRRVRWTILRPIATSLWGDERSSYRSPGMELTEVRPYQAGDDIRFIDWNITARTEQPMVRVAQLERAVDVWFLIDLSASMQWGTALCLKQDRAREFAAVAGQVLNRNGNRLGAIFFADRPLEIVPPAAGRLHLLRLLSELRERANQKRKGSTGLEAALKQAETVITRRSLILVISDFLAPDGWQMLLSKLAVRHEVVAVRLYDPREGALPDVGLITFEDPETGEQLVVNTADKKLRERFQQAAQSQDERIRSALLACGVDLLLLDTHEELLPTFVRFLAARQQKRVRRANHSLSWSSRQSGVHRV